MTGNFGNWDDQTLDLAIRAFTEGIDPQSLEELNRSATAKDLESFELSLGAIHWSHSDQVVVPPAETMKRLEREASLWLGGPHKNMAPLPVELPKRQPRNPWFAAAGWAVAAALCVLLFVQEGKGPGAPTPAESMNALVAQAADLQRIPWSVTEDPLASGASGEVIWSDELQEGYMIFQGLEPNDPALAQFQLWIFDPSRADWDTSPVDGGVFDVSASGKVVVPITARLPVQDVALFAITSEVPGGVVVSKREHLLLTAKSS
ncbi:MAG: anti-sigma factor [Planctomycetota bacterium]|nr:anti-sigma factor [Planctomycetota bacterium]